MKAVQIMEKTIGAFEVRRQFGQMLTGILTNNDRFIVERHGSPVAVIVPVAVYEQWKQGRKAFFDRLEETARAANCTPEEADALADEAVAAVRARRRKASA